MLTDGNCLMSFEELIEHLQKKGIDNWPCVLLPKSSPLYSDLNERLRDTWWEVAWPSDEQNGTPECSYLADSLSDALRRRPRIHMASSARLLCTAEELLALMAPWQHDDNEQEDYWYDSQFKCQMC